ncbi:MAG: zinc-binding dehydrogenase [Deltaproteobacteria bacterium]|nr:zinc-binding dehydrogenase [Deltaproteobacteria bacterium]MBW2285516.1 zinc-binding dehydrogenase [Deltaproteobacteria bacterium]
MQADAMVLEQFNEPLEMKTFRVPGLDRGEVLVKVLVAGVCGSDVYMSQGLDARLKLPMILGHEGVGEVVEIEGEKTYVDDGSPVRVGDKVLWSRGVTCGHCYFCKIKNEPSLCLNRWVWGIHLSCADPPYLTGNYAQYLPLHRNADLFRLDPDADLEAFVAASCSGGTTAHAVDLAGIEPGDTVLVQGPGPVGIYAVAFAHALGASRIFVTGGTLQRLDICRSFGATTIMNRFETTAEERREIVLEKTQGMGVDVAFEMVGAPEALSECISLTRIGGACVTAGFGEPHGSIEIDCFHDIGRKNLRLQGVWVSDVRHTHMSLKLTMSRLNDFKRIVTHRFPLSGANEALAVMKAKEAVKAVILPHG